MLMWSMVIVTLGEEGEGQLPFIRELNDSHVGHVLTMAPLSAYIHCKNIICYFWQLHLSPKLQLWHGFKGWCKVSPLRQLSMWSIATIEIHPYKDPCHCNKLVFKKTCYVSARLSITSNSNVCITRHAAVACMCQTICDVTSSIVLGKLLQCEQKGWDRGRRVGI